ncbi:MAG: hypothetical protein HQK84_09110, partial [Nitrospinae bacterium]|nr:hypothetical protein [Nitrospinota bacterium]
NFFENLKDDYDELLLNRALNFIKEMKRIVKENFALDYFYKTEEIIEEVRGLGGGIVVPHPEQFWPILLAEYDVDGYEVWNPQSREFTEFLINVVNKQNKQKRFNKKDLLIFMGDDCHMGEKVKDSNKRKPEKYKREIGVQEAWDDLTIRKSLIFANTDRSSVIDEYTARLKG